MGCSLADASTTPVRPCTFREPRPASSPLGTPANRYVWVAQSGIVATDWNWFFAAFAQSLAAVIAIVGAFIVSKILDAEANGRSLRDEANRWVRRYENLRTRMAYRYPDWVVRIKLGHAKEAMFDDIKQVVQRGEDLDMDQAMLASYPYVSEYTSPERLDEQMRAWVEEARQEIERERREAAQPMAHVQRQVRLITDMQIRPELNVARMDLNQRVEAEEERINSIRSDGESVMGDLEVVRERIARHNAELESFNPLILGGLVLFLLGVVFPLSVLPTNGPPTLALGEIPSYYASLRGVLVLLAGVGIPAFFLYLRYRVANAHIDDDDLPNEYVKPGGPSTIHEAFQERENLERIMTDIEARIEEPQD